MINVADGLFLFTAAVFAGLWWRARSASREAMLACEAAEQSRSRLDAVVAASPVAGFRWRRDGSFAGALGRFRGKGPQLSLDRFMADLDSADAERINAAVDALRETGKGFDVAVSAPDGSAYHVEGRATESGEAVVWIADVSAVAAAEGARAAAVAEAARLREMLELLPLPVWRRDDRLRLIDCNAAYAACLDASREAVLSQSSELAPDGTPDEAPARARAVLTAGAPRTEIRHVTIDGSRRLLRLAEAPSRSGGTIGYAIDRTEVETAESELARHADAYAQVLEIIHTAIAIWGADKRLKFFNSAFVELWGVEEDWLVGEPSFGELLERLRERRRVPEFADFRAFKRQQLSMFTSLIEPHSDLMHLPDGRTLSVSVSPHPLGGLIFVYEDVTDRLALERSYNTSIAVRRETLDNLFEAIAVFGSDGRLKLHNPAYRKMWGLDEADLADEPHVGEIVEKTRRFYREASNWADLRDRIIARITAQAEWSGSLDRSDGSTLQLGTVPLPDGNVLLTCLDVTDSTRVERVLRERNDALETTGRLKSEFIANVSYELRTPLNAIIGFAEILANQYFGTLTPRQLEYGRGILDSSRRLMSLINDILDLATIEAGNMVLATGRVEICGMLETVAALFRERARSRNVALEVDCPPDIGAIEADERRLKQALFNLVSNAIKFTPTNGSIRLEARLDDQAGQGDVILAVRDTGIGIPASDRDRVFEKFERGKLGAGETGAGLGLSLVKSLVELHGGTVAIKSEPDQGTAIVCRLPATMRLPAPPAQKAPTDG